MRLLLILCCCCLALPAFAADELVMERNIDCKSMKLAPENFKLWKLADKALPRDEAAERKDEKVNTTSRSNRRAQVQSTVTFDTTLPKEAIVELDYKISLLWQRRSNKEYDLKTGTVLMMGSEGKPPHLVLSHADSFKVDKVEVLALRCSRVKAKETKKEEKKAETPATSANCTCPEPAATAPVATPELPSAPKPIPSFGATPATSAPTPPAEPSDADSLPATLQ